MKKLFIMAIISMIAFSSCTDGRKQKDFPTTTNTKPASITEKEDLPPVKIPRYATQVCDTTIGKWHVVTYVDTNDKLIKAEDGEIYDSSLHLTADYDGHRIIDNREITTSDIIGYTDGEHGFHFARIIMATQNTLFLQAGAYI